MNSLCKLTSMMSFILLSAQVACAAAVSPENIFERSLAIACEDNFQVFDNTQVQTMESAGVCYVSVHPRNVERLVYRDFLFDSVGLMMVFDSYGEGSESQTTAARNYHFFPRQTSLSYRYFADSKRLEVTLPSGKVVGFSTVKAVMLDISGSKVDFNYEVNPEHRGGVEIVANDGLLMDGGFQRGQSPSQNPEGKVVLRDSAGSTCSLKNSEVYRYTEDKDAIFKFTDKGLKSFLASRCKALKP